MGKVAHQDMGNLDIAKLAQQDIVSLVMVKQDQPPTDNKEQDGPHPEIQT